MLLIIVLAALAAALVALTALRCRQASACIDLILTEELGRGPEALDRDLRALPAADTEERAASVPVSRRGLAGFGQI